MMTTTKLAAIVAMVPYAALAEEPTTPVTCVASDYRTGAEFDLTKLQNVIKEIPDGQSQKMYMIAPCGKKPLEHWDESCEFPYACQNTRTEKFKLATSVYRDKLQPLVTDGSVPHGAMLVMRYGDNCHNEEQRSLTVHYYCDKDEDQRIEVVESFHCAYDAYIYTKEACPTMPSAAMPSNNPCTYTDGQNHYDLSPLKKLIGNHVVTGRALYDPNEADESNEQEYIINVCQDININKAYAHDSALRNCHKDGDFPGICQVYYKGKDQIPHYRMLGQTALLGENNDYEKLQMINGVLTLQYNRGTKTEHGPIRNSEIRFHCLRGSGDGAPEYEREEHETGTYYFSWTTEHACPKGGSEPEGMSGGAIFALIVFVIIPCSVLLYCLVGMFCNRQSGKSGMEMVPHIDILRKVFGCCSSSGATKGLSIQADGETGQSLMDDDDYN